MHVHFLGEPDDDQSVSSQHAHAFRAIGWSATFENQPIANSADDQPGRAKADLLHLVTGVQHDHALLRRIIAARKSGQMAVRWWKQQDILWAQHHQPTRRFAQFLDQLDVLSLTAFESSVEQLSRIGVHARQAPPLNPNIHSLVVPEPLPATFTILTYLPSEQREFHGGRMIDQLIERLPDARFLILGDEATDYSKHSNVESLGFIDDLSRAIRRSTVLAQLRIDQQPSRLVYEALCHGRFVVSTAAIPSCERVSSIEDCLKALRQLRREAKFNLEGREFVCKEHDAGNAVQFYQAAFEELVRPGGMQLAIHGAMRAAKFLMFNPSVLSKKPFPPLRLEDVPPDAVAIRALLKNSSPVIAHV